MPKRTIEAEPVNTGEVATAEPASTEPALPTSVKVDLSEISVVEELDSSRLLQRGNPTGGGFGRQMADFTAQVLQMLRQNPGQWIGPVSYDRAPAPLAGRFLWVGYHEDGTGPTSVEEEKAVKPDDYAIKRKIVSRYYKPEEHGTNAGLRAKYLSMTDESWKPPVPRKPKDEAVVASNGQETLPMDVEPF